MNLSVSPNQGKPGDSVNVRWSGAPTAGTLQLDDGTGFVDVTSANGPDGSGGVTPTLNAAVGAPQIYHLRHLTDGVQDAEAFGDTAVQVVAADAAPAGGGGGPNVRGLVVVAPGANAVNMRGPRHLIVRAARGEVGKVANTGGQDGNKKGWERLKGYFEAALGDADIFQRGQDYKDGIMKAGKFVPNPGQHPPIIDWCGLFAVWCVRQGGLDVRWVFGQGPQKMGAARTDFAKMLAGDILVLRTDIHHCIVSEFDGANISMVNGNDVDQGIGEVSKKWSEAGPRKVASSADPSKLVDAGAWYYYSAGPADG